MLNSLVLSLCGQGLAAQHSLTRAGFGIQTPAFRGVPHRIKAKDRMGMRRHQPLRRFDPAKTKRGSIRLTGSLCHPSQPRQPSNPSSGLFACPSRSARARKRTDTDFVRVSTLARTAHTRPHSRTPFSFWKPGNNPNWGTLTHEGDPASTSQTRQTSQSASQPTRQRLARPPRINLAMPSHAIITPPTKSQPQL